MKRLVRGASWEDRGNTLKEDLMNGMEERCTEKCDDVGFRLTCNRKEDEIYVACGASPGAVTIRDTRQENSTECTRLGAGTEG